MPTIRFDREPAGIDAVERYRDPTGTFAAGYRTHAGGVIEVDCRAHGVRAAARVQFAAITSRTAFTVPPRCGATNPGEKTPRTATASHPRRATPRFMTSPAIGNAARCR
ncbi:hypothetical protein [Benzoatithermus flavus]|uniref:Uncharacterized protein n=1 Tax=Benzoatithermus flavus TaxID=3108223 RepID=A0ABU8XXZ9_9PROT